MKMTQAATDKLAIGLSLVCAIHCLTLPFLLALIPSIGALQLDNEGFHLWMVLLVLPTSIYALNLGCKQHQRYQLLLLGCFGLTLLVLALVLEDMVGETGEKLLTLTGATFVALGHWLNYRQCKKRARQDCATSNNPKGKAL